MPALSRRAEQPDPAPAVRMRLSTPAEILAAVPYLLGFTPEKSLVLIGLRGKTVGLTMRLDIDAALEMRELFVARLRSDGATNVVLILLDPEPDQGRRPGAHLMRTLIRACEREGIHTKDALGVRDGRYWSYLCTDASCCPSRGRVVPQAGSAAHSKVAAPFVAIGSSPLVNRAALEASIETVTGKRRTALDAAYLLALREPVSHPSLRWEEAVRRSAGEDGGRPARAFTTAEAVRLVLGLNDVLVRDEVLSWTAGESNTGVLAVLRELARLALPPFDTNVLAVLAWASFSFGDGALASVALERALTADPGHPLAGLLASALDSGVTPTQLHQISRQLGGLFGELLPDAPQGVPAGRDRPL